MCMWKCFLSVYNLLFLILISVLQMETQSLDHARQVLSTSLLVFFFNLRISYIHIIHIMHFVQAHTFPFSSRYFPTPSTMIPFQLHALFLKADSVQLCCLCVHRCRAIYWNMG